MQTGLIKISDKIEEWKMEASGYTWADDETDKPIKENDHLMDAMRYFVRTNRVVRRGYVHDAFSSE
jgi:hypothetical protein